MIPKRFAFWLIILNGFFLAVNTFFLILGSSPTANFISGMVCLAGLMSSYQLYINADE